MTGLLTQAAATEHINDLRAVAAKRRRPAFAGLHRPRRALAA
jgi:hypothetical protein